MTVPTAKRSPAPLDRPSPVHSTPDSIMPVATVPETVHGSENSPEVFLGPTGSETEEFYGFQRQNPGLDKTAYLDWFQSRFHKEIELRRRRSDQPSDLEYMVIKKRSKYRERIGEESAELVAFSDQNPSKTYRELAEWFQTRFGKEIDITAISRALKRNRQELDGPPHPDAAPAAKRGRRSLNPGTNAANNVLHNAPTSGSAVGSTPTFAVDMKGRSGYRSNTHTPNHTPGNTPGHTPKNGHAVLARELQPEYSEDRKPSITSLTQPSQPSGRGYHPHHLGSHPGGSPSSHSSADGPRWAAVNSTPLGARLDANGRSPPRVAQAPPPPPPPPSQPQPPPLQPAPANHHSSGTRVLRSKSISQQQPQPLAPAPAAPPKPAPNAVVASFPPHNPPPPPHNPPHNTVPNGLPIARPPPLSPVRDAAAQLEARYRGLMDHHFHTTEEFRRLHSDIFSTVHTALDSAERDRAGQAERKALVEERENLIASANYWEKVTRELSTGNIELQHYKDDFESQQEAVHDLQRQNSALQAQLAQAEEKLRERNYQLANAQKVLRENGFDEHGSRCSSVDAGERKSRKELDEWFMERINRDVHNEKTLSALVDAVEGSGVRDMDRNLTSLRSYVTSMSVEREHRKEEWKRMAGILSDLQRGSTSPQPRIRPDDEIMRDTDGPVMNGEMNGQRKDSQESSKELTPISAGRPSPHSSTATPIGDLDTKMEEA